jgi:transposase InsO family protein
VVLEKSTLWFANIRFSDNGLTFIGLQSKNRGSMPTLIVFLFRFARLLFSGHAAVAVENAALRLQLAAFQRQRRRPVLTSLDRLFWIGLSLLWKRWRSPLIYVRADTVVSWQRQRFRRFWARLSKRNQRPRGRPATAGEIRRLIDGMAAANPLWRAPRIHGELKMLGIEISERTVSRLLRKLPRRPSQTWKTFLHNQLGQTVSMDFFTVPTITMKVLFVFLVLEHRRREVLHFNVTEHPSAAWTSQQIVEAFADQNPPYGNEVRLRIASLQMEEVLTAPRSPWQNPYAERLIGSIRRDCLDHLKRTLSSYFAYYHGSRTHLGLDKQCPHARQVSSVGRIVKIPHFGGLHHRYERIAA